MYEDLVSSQALLRKGSTGMLQNGIRNDWSKNYISSCEPSSVRSRSRLKVYNKYKVVLENGWHKLSRLLFLLR